MSLIAGLVGALGCVVGSTITYWIGATGGRPLLLKYGKYVLISPHHIELADKWFAEKGEATAFFSRLLPVVRTFISLPAGIARMNFPRFILYTFAGLVHLVRRRSRPAAITRARTGTVSAM